PRLAPPRRSHDIRKVGVLDHRSTTHCSHGGGCVGPERDAAAAAERTSRRRQRRRLVALEGVVLSDHPDDLRLVALPTRADLELDRLTLLEGLVALDLDVGEVDEHVVATLT